MERLLGENRNSDDGTGEEEEEDNLIYLNGFKTKMASKISICGKKIPCRKKSILSVIYNFGLNSDCGERYSKFQVIFYIDIKTKKVLRKEFLGEKSVLFNHVYDMRSFNIEGYDAIN